MAKNNNIEYETIEYDAKEVVEHEDTDLTSRINRLYGEEIYGKEEQKEYDPKEVANVRKKLLLLFSGVFIVGIVIVTMFFQSLDFQEIFESESQIKENNEELQPEIEYPIELDLLNDLSLLLNNRVNFSLQEFKKYDIFPIYTKDKILVNDFPNDLKLFLLSKTKDFNQMLKTNGIDNYLSTCDGNGLTINKTKVFDVSNLVFANNTYLELDTINYEYIMTDGNSKKITLSSDGDNYIVKCNEYSVNDSITKYIQQKLIKVVESKDSIELYQNVVFIKLDSDEGVYLDPLFKTLITNNKNAQLDSYINQGSTYKYTFIKDEYNYRFESIELMKEV